VIAKNGGGVSSPDEGVTSGRQWLRIKCKLGPHTETCAAAASEAEEESWRRGAVTDDRLKVSENKVLRKRNVTGGWENYLMERFITGSLQHTLLR
jgi:hypothetical protein